MNLPLAHSLALSLHSTHPLSCRFLAGLNESFPTRCGRSCGMPFCLKIAQKPLKHLPGLRPGPAESTHLWPSTPVSLDPPPRPRARGLTLRVR